MFRETDWNNWTKMSAARISSNWGALTACSFPVQGWRDALGWREYSPSSPILYRFVGVIGASIYASNRVPLSRSSRVSRLGVRVRKSDVVVIAYVLSADHFSADIIARSIWGGTCAGCNGG